MIHCSFKPGDLPPGGYNNWHEWARVQHRAGLRQRTCCKCGLWFFPQEMTGATQTEELIDGKTGERVALTSPICRGCFSPDSP